MMLNLPKIITKVRISYHAHMLDVNNILNQFGIMNDEKCEESNKKHAMIIFKDCFVRLGYDISELMEEDN